MPDVQLGLEKLPHLQAVLPEQLGLVPQTGQALFQHVKHLLLLRGEQADLVAFQFTGHPVQLVIVPQPTQGLLSQGRELRVEALQISCQHAVLQLGQLVFQLLQVVQVPDQKLLQKFTEKAAGTVFLPALFLSHALEDGVGCAGIVTKHHPVPGEQIPEGHPVSFPALARDHHRATQAVPAHLRLAHPGVPGGGSMAEHFLQPRQPGIAVQFLGCEQVDRCHSRCRRPFQQRQALAQTIDIHTVRLHYPRFSPLYYKVGRETKDFPDLRFRISAQTKKETGSPSRESLSPLLSRYGAATCFNQILYPAGRNYSMAMVLVSGSFC